MTDVGRLLRQFFGRHLAWTLVWLLCLVMIAAGINLIGIQIIGDVSGWSRWLHRHRLYFLAWRLCLYAGTVFGWLRMRERLLSSEPAAHTPARLLRAEVAAVLTVLLLETSLFLQPQ